MKRRISYYFFCMMAANALALSSLHAAEQQQVDRAKLSEQQKKALTYKLLMALADDSPIKDIEKIIDEGADPLSDDYSYSPFFSAIDQNRVDAVRMMLDKKVDPNCKDEFGWTPLIHARWRAGSKDMIKLLLQRGADQKYETEDGISLFDSRHLTIMTQELNITAILDEYNQSKMAEKEQ